MKRPFKKLHFVVILCVAFLFTLSTSYIELSYLGVVGNLCPQNPGNLCYKKLPMGGFPIPYLYDNGGVSVVGKLSFFDDYFYFLYFWADWIMIAILLEVAVWVVKR